MSNIDSRQHALATLARSHGQQAWATAYSLCRNAADAEDLVQKAFLVASRRKEGLPDGAEWPWLAKVIVNLYRNEWRKSVRRGEVVSDDSLSGTPDKRAVDPSANAELSDVGQRLRAQLKLLPLDEKEALVLTHITGLSHQAAAESLDIPRTTLASRVKSGMERLRRKMGKDDGEVVAMLSSALIVPPQGGYTVAIERWTSGVTNTPVGFGAKLLAAVGVACAAVAVVAAWVVLFNGATSPQITANEIGDDAVAAVVDKSDVAADTRPAEADNGPSSSLFAFEFNEEERQRFLEVRPRRLSESPPDFFLPRQFGTREEYEASLREAAELERMRSMKAGPWSYPTQLESERSAHVQGLVELQDREGYVHPDGVFPGRPKLQRDAQASREVNPPADCVFSTAMTMLALARAGRDHKAGDSRPTARQAVLWARKIQNNDGQFGQPPASDAVIQHAAATLAMLEVYRATGDLVLKPIIDKAVVKLYELRNPDGAWGSGPDRESNVLATGFSVLALASSMHPKYPTSLGRESIPDVLVGTANWLWGLRDSETTRWSTNSVESPHGLPSGRLADAVFVIGVHWGEYWTLGDFSVERALQRLREQATDWSSCDPMTRFFTSIALWTVDPARSVQWSLDTIQAIESAAQNHVGQNGNEETRWLGWSGEDAYTARLGKAFCTAASVFVLYQCRSYLPSIEITDPSGALLADHIKVLDSGGNVIGRPVQMFVGEDSTATAVFVTDLPSGTVTLVIVIDEVEILRERIETAIDQDLQVTMDR